MQMLVEMLTLSLVPFVSLLRSTSWYFLGQITFITAVVFMASHGVLDNSKDTPGVATGRNRLIREVVAAGQIRAYSRRFLSRFVAAAKRTGSSLLFSLLFACTLPLAMLLCPTRPSLTAGHHCLSQALQVPLQHWLAAACVELRDYCCAPQLSMLRWLHDAQQMHMVLCST